MWFNGAEYQASWDDAMRIARSTRAAGLQRGLTVQPAQIDTIRQAAVAAAQNISGQAAMNPYLNIGAMTRSIPSVANPNVPTTERCTCFKVDPFTCVTAAHCVANSWTHSKHPFTWQSLANIQFGAADPVRARGVIDPTDSPYMMVIPAGYWADGADELTLDRFDFAVIRFRGTLQVPNTGGDLEPVNGPSPLTNPLIPGVLYDTGSPGSLSMAELPTSSVQKVTMVGYTTHSMGGLMSGDGVVQRPDNGGVLWYQVDTADGDSGGPILWTDEQGKLRVVGIHHGLPPGGLVGFRIGVQLTLDVIDWITAVHGY
jgi:hypothetical protein